MSKTIEEIIAYTEGLEGYSLAGSQRYLAIEVAERFAKSQSEKLEKQLDILFKLLSHIQNREVHVNDSIDKLINNALDEISKL